MPWQPVRPTVAGTYPAGCYVYEKVSPADKGNGELPPGLSDNGRWTVLGSHLVPGTRQKVLNRGYAVNLQDQTVTRITPPTLNGDHPVALESGYSAPPVVVGDNERTILPTGAWRPARWRSTTSTCRSVSR